MINSELIMDENIVVELDLMETFELELQFHLKGWMFHEILRQLHLFEMEQVLRV
jgi:hypothetical protein